MPSPWPPLVEDVVSEELLTTLRERYALQQKHWKNACERAAPFSNGIQTIEEE